MENQNKIHHFVGIKGSGMSSLALILARKSATKYKGLMWKNILHST